MSQIPLFRLETITYAQAETNETLVLKALWGKNICVCCLDRIVHGCIFNLLSIINYLMFYRKKLPCIFQSEIAECGLACLAMIFGYLCLNVSLNDLRQYIKSSTKGVTLFQLKRLSEHYGLIANVLRVEIDQLSTLTLPCVIHWDMNHFMVLYEVNLSGIKVHDPSRGKRYIPYDEVARYFTGIVLELSLHRPQEIMSTKSVNILSSSTNQLLLNVIKNHTNSILKLLVISCVIQFFYVSGINIIQSGLDTSCRQHTFNIIVWVLAAFLGTKLVESATMGIRSLMINAIGGLIYYEFSHLLMKRLISLPVSFFENRTIGNIYTRFGAIDKIRHIATEGAVEGMVDGLMSMSLLMLMFSLNAAMAFILTLFSIIFVVSRVYFECQNRQFQEENMHARLLEMSHFMETLRAMTPVKIFSRQKVRVSSWANKFIHSINTSTKLAWHKAGYEFVKNLIYGVELSITLSIGCLFLERSTLSLGVFYAFLAYRQQFTNMIGRLADKIQDYKLLRVNLDRLDDMTAECDENMPTTHSCDECLVDFRDKLVLENVTFSYSRYDNAVLNNINLMIRKGECVAITGSSGCGKTTLFKMMLGLLAPTSGTFYCDNHSVYDGHVDCYSKKIAAVMQDDVLLSGSVIENISFFEKNADIAFVQKCAELAGIMDDINLLPMRFHTLIGDQGSVFSGGQKQRLLLARALYARPQILFLDEGTSHLDVVKERSVNAAIRRLGITVVMIAHREETIRMADRIIALDLINEAVSQHNIHINEVSPGWRPTTQTPNAQSQNTNMI